MTTRSTIYALASGRPPAAIAIIRVSGPAAHEAAMALAGTLPPPRQAALRQIRSKGGELLDEAVVLRFDGPASSTGEDVVEFHCHGGRAVVDAVLQALGTCPDLQLANPGEFTRRAFENGRIDLTEAEGLADLLEAETEGQRKAALALADGVLRRQIERWQSRLLAISARAEAAIDYVEEDGIGSDPALASDCSELAAELREWLSQPRMELLRHGLSVVLAGPPNSGKSSLLNALAGIDAAIVTEIPGTTRDRIDVMMTVEGLPIRLTDTAGIRQAEDEVERIGVARSHEAVASADLVLWLGAPEDRPDKVDVILVHGRTDLPERRDVPQGSIPVSALTGHGLSELVHAIGRFVGSAISPNSEVPLNQRQAALLEEASTALDRAGRMIDAELIAENSRVAMAAFHRITGRSGLEDLLDAIFGRFCLGK